LIDYEHEQMDIFVDLKNTTKGSAIIREVHRCKFESRKICANCGTRKGNNSSLNRIYCNKCISDQTVEKKTGTWLDRY
jgi:hypothetical protein